MTPDNPKFWFLLGAYTSMCAYFASQHNVAYMMLSHLITQLQKET